MNLENIPNLADYDTIINSNIVDDEVVQISDAVDKSLKTGDRYSSGFSMFDGAIRGGFKDGDLIIITGISGQGKTSLAQTLTYNLCKNAVPCLWFSYEVTIDQLDEKFKAMGIEDFYSAYTPKKNTSGRLDWIKYKIREAHTKFMTKVVFIDHIDFLTPDDVKSGDNQQIAYKKIATQLKSLAIELRVVIVLMAHLKKLENDKKEPDMQDIGYSAGIFQLADYVFMIFRELVEQPKKLSQRSESGIIHTNKSIIKLIKNRETGQTCFIKTQYMQGKFNELIDFYEGHNQNFERVKDL